MKFEQKIAELEKLSQTIENNSSTLEESMDAFEKSLSLAEQCLQELNNYKGKLTVLEKRMTALMDEDED